MLSGQASACEIDRRTALRAVAGVAATGVALAAARPARAQSASDIDALNFVLNMEYLIAQYASAVVGAPVPADRLSGNGVAGTPVTGARSLTFTDNVLRAAAIEMATDSRNHLLPIRFVIGALSVRQPLLDIGATATSAFSVAMQRAGVVGPGVAFDPYASEENFLYAMFLLKNISVAAYRGMASTISNRVVVQNFTGLLGTEAIHSATIRGVLYSRGATVPRMRENADKIAAFQRSLNGAQAFQGLSPVTRSVPGSTTTITVANLSAAGANGEVAGRSAAQTLNQLYLTAGSATSGGFFPEGVNGTIRASAAA